MAPCNHTLVPDVCKAAPQARMGVESLSLRCTCLRETMCATEQAVSGVGFAVACHPGRRNESSKTLQVLAMQRNTFCNFVSLALECVFTDQSQCAAYYHFCVVGFRVPNHIHVGNVGPKGPRNTLKEGGGTWGVGEGLAGVSGGRLPSPLVLKEVEEGEGRRCLGVRGPSSGSGRAALTACADTRLSLEAAGNQPKSSGCL